MIDPSEAEPLLEALAAGANPAADLLQSLLAGDPLDEKRDTVSVEWLTDAYTFACTEYERSTFRDAILLILRQASRRFQEGRPAVIAATVNLGIQTEVLELKPHTVQERLLNAVEDLYSAGDPVSAAIVLGFVADHGRKRSVSEWSRIMHRYGSYAILPCVHGIARHGAEAAIEWIFSELEDPTLQDDAFHVTLPWLVDFDPRGVAAVTRSQNLEHKKLQDYLVELQLRLPAYATGPAFETDDGFTVDYYDESASNDGGRVSRSYQEYDEINRTAESPDRAMERWLQATEAAALPESVTRALEGG